MSIQEQIEQALQASDEVVGPACINVVVPPTINMEDDFREAYVQGYRHALSDVRQYLAMNTRDYRTVPPCAAQEIPMTPDRLAALEAALTDDVMSSVLRACEAPRLAGYSLRNVTSAGHANMRRVILAALAAVPAPPAERPRHGIDCKKEKHVRGVNYLHDSSSDYPYPDDGLWYCGRCHHWLPEERAREANLAVKRATVPPSHPPSPKE